MDSKEIIGNAMEEVLEEEFEEYINDLPLYADHKFSDRHNRKMRKLIKRQRKPYFKLISTAGRRAACIVTAVLIFSSSALSVEAVRNAVFDFISKIFSDHNVVTVEGGTDSGYPETIEKEYYISKLPSEFIITNRFKTDNSIDISYQNDDKYVMFSQYTKSAFVQYIDNEKTQYTEIQDSGTVYMALINDSDTTYIWDNGSYIFIIQSNLDKDTVLNLCKSTRLK